METDGNIRYQTRSGLKTQRRCQWFGNGLRKRLIEEHKKNGGRIPKIGYAVIQEPTETP